jgi:hypothetical protein
MCIADKSRIVNFESRKNVGDLWRQILNLGHRDRYEAIYYVCRMKSIKAYP